METPLAQSRFLESRRAEVWGRCRRRDLCVLFELIRCHHIGSPCLRSRRLTQRHRGRRLCVVTAALESITRLGSLTPRGRLGAKLFLVLKQRSLAATLWNPIRELSQEYGTLRRT
jgi:hypothetical protein